MAYIEPPNPDERGTWHLVRGEQIQTWTWNPRARHWIIGERWDRLGRYEETGGMVAAENGWRLGDRLS